MFNSYVKENIERLSLINSVHLYIIHIGIHFTPWNAVCIETKVTYRASSDKNSNVSENNERWPPSTSLSNAEGKITKIVPMVL